MQSVVKENKDINNCFRNLTLLLLKLLNFNIKQLILILTQQYKSQLNKTEDKKELLFKLIKKFRNYIKLRNVKKICNITDNLTFSIF